MGGEGDHQQQREGSEEASGVGNASAATVIHIRCTNGSRFSVETNLEANVGAFKVLLAEKCDIPADQQRLIYKGRILKDDNSLHSYGLQSEHTVHLVRGASTSGSTNVAAAENTVSPNSMPAPPVQGVPSNNNGGFGGPGLGSLLFPGLGGNGLGGDGLGGNNPTGLFGAGLPEFQQVQQQLTQNPNMIREMMNMPAIQNLMNNPDLMRNLIMSNPQMREIIDRNPDLAHILNDPGTLRQTLDAARNPELMREMMRNTDRAMSNIESSPEGFNMLRRMYETVQEPFLNATTMGGDSGNDLGSNPFAALFGQGPACELASHRDAMTVIFFPLLLLLVLLFWVGVCQLLRYKRLRLISSMDPVRDAVALSKLTLFVEFPLLSRKALEFSLFKTFAIPSISKLLAATRQFSPATVNKRYDDTDILIQEFLVNHVDSSRGSRALRRLNFIHGRFNISNQDFLYTLSTFILEPKRFASKFGYRDWTEKETTANFVVWRDIGTRMGIQHIPNTVNEVERFSLQYEAEKMVYSDSNREIGDATLNFLLSILPACFRPGVRRIIYCLFEDRLVDAMDYPHQPYWLILVVEAVLKVCVGSFVRWFLPPRPLSWSTERISLEEEDEKKVQKLRYSEYKPETYPNGYRIDEVGDAEPGGLEVAFDGDLLCPFFSSFSNQKKVVA